MTIEKAELLGLQCYSQGMSIDQLTTLTVAYLEADSGDMPDRQRDLEAYLRQAGNSEEQIRFWMGFCINPDGDEDGDLRSVVETDAGLSVLNGKLAV